MTEQQFHILFKKYFATLCLNASKFVDKETAEDITQESFIALWETQKDFTDYNALRFLYATVRNKSLNYINAKRIKQVELPENLSIEDDVGYDYEFIHTIVINNIYNAIEHLPSKQKQVFKMRFIEQRKVEEIALSLNIATKTVYNHLDKAIANIKTFK